MNQMTETENLEKLQAGISIDTKEYRIRIHKRTIHLLGDPEYIQILVNPVKCQIAIRPSTQKDYLALHVRKTQRECVFQTINLIRNIQAIAGCLLEPATYRLYGRLCRQDHALYFPLEQYSNSSLEKKDSGGQDGQ